MRENIVRWAEEVSGRPFRAEARLIFIYFLGDQRPAGKDSKAGSADL